MDSPVSNSQFRLMAHWYRLRDILAPRIKILAEVGIRSGFRVLDFGCGPGSYLIPLSRLVGPKGRVFALDLHPLAIARVKSIVRKKRLDNVEVIESHGATGLPDASVDVALLYEIFHDLTEPEEILKELFRVLRPEGVLSVIDQYIPEQSMLAGITRDRGFRLQRKGRKTYTFSKSATR